MPSADYCQPLTSTLSGSIEQRERLLGHSWLKLPCDTVTVYFHSAAVDGGVSVPMLAHQVPLIKVARAMHLVDSEDPAIQALLVTPAARQLIESQTRSRQLNDTVVTSTRCLRSALAQTLYQSLDGRGLVDVSLVLQQHLWVSSGSPVLSGSAYVGAVKIRGNLMATALHKSHGRQLSSRCDCCLRTESLGHILQVCPRMHASRVARLDKTLELVAAGASRLGLGICREPAIPKPAGIHRPDPILDHQDTVIVLHVTIVADNANLYQAYQHKCDYYYKPGIRSWVSRNVSTASPPFSSVTLNWRGLLAPPSAEVIRTRVERIVLEFTVSSDP